MDEIKNLLVNTEEIYTSFSDGVFMLKFKKNIFDFLTEFEHRDFISKFMKNVKSCSEISIILVINEPGSFDSSEFYKKITSSTKKYDTISNINFREVNILNNYIKEIVKSPKLSIVGLQGNIITPFFGMSLAFDYRILSEISTFNINHRKFAEHPSGCLPFFLQQYLSRGVVSEILYEKDLITAQEAFRFGLVNHIFPVEGFEEKCFDRAKELTSIKASVVTKTKKIMNYQFTDLENYIKCEADLLREQIH